MTIKSKHVSVPVARAIHGPLLPPPPPTASEKLKSFFRLHSSVLRRRSPEVFRDLRVVWGVDETAYKDSFRANPDYRAVPDSEDDGDAISVASFVDRNRGRGCDDDDDPRGVATLRRVARSDAGFAWTDGGRGVASFATPDGKFVVAVARSALDRGGFFGSRALQHYHGRMCAAPQNLLLRVSDALVPGHKSLGLAVGTAAGLFVVQENPVAGKTAETLGPLWEVYELAPTVRSPAAAVGSAASVASPGYRRRDAFGSQVSLDDALHQQLMDLVRDDTHALAQAGVCGYKLALIRFPAGVTGLEVDDNAGPFRSGVPDKTGEWRYRIFITDFWREDMPTGPGQLGPWEYRRSFLQLVEGIFEGGNPPRYRLTPPPPEYVE